MAADAFASWGYIYVYSAIRATVFPTNRSMHHHSPIHQFSIATQEASLIQFKTNPAWLVNP
jgi:hypothetical protein